MLVPHMDDLTESVESHQDGASEDRDAPMMLLQRDNRAALILRAPPAAEILEPRRDAERSRMPCQECSSGFFWRIPRRCEAPSERGQPAGVRICSSNHGSLGKSLQRLDLATGPLRPALVPWSARSRLRRNEAGGKNKDQGQNRNGIAGAFQLNLLNLPERGGGL